eukprot:EG_transcript_26270
MRAKGKKRRSALLEMMVGGNNQVCGEQVVRNRATFLGNWGPDKQALPGNCGKDLPVIWGLRGIATTMRATRGEAGVPGGQAGTASLTAWTGRLLWWEIVDCMNAATWVPNAEKLSPPVVRDSVGRMGA